MRILSVSAQRPDSTGSGVYLTELVRGFDDLGQEQAVLAGVGPEDVSPFPENVAFFPVRYESAEMPFPICGMSDEMPYRSTRYRDMTQVMTAQFRAAFSAALRKAVDAFQPDVILCHHLYALTALVRELFPERRVCGICHGSDLRQIRKNPWQRDWIVSRIAELDRVFALHEQQKLDIAGLYALPEERIRVIGTGFNSGVFRRLPEAERRGEGVRLLFAGKLSEKKGVFSLLRALSLLQAPERFTLTLAGGYGDQAEYDAIRALAAEAPCPVLFPGKLSQAELAREMNGSDVFVLPSFYEGLPLVLIEAMACGMRCVCTDLPGIRPWLDARLPGHGVTFVAPPAMHNQDEPESESLPGFERELAAALSAALSAPRPAPEAIAALSCEGLCKTLLPLL